MISFKLLCYLVYSEAAFLLWVDTDQDFFPPVNFVLMTIAREYEKEWRLT
jgi:hypothetical protein